MGIIGGFVLVGTLCRGMGVGGRGERRWLELRKYVRFCSVTTRMKSSDINLERKKGVSKKSFYDIILRSIMKNREDSCIDQK